MRCRLKHILIILSLLFIQLLSSSLLQAQVLDQDFTQFYQSAKSDERIKAGLQITAHFIKTGSPDSALHYVSLLKEIPNLYKSEKDLANLYRYESQGLMMRGELGESIRAMREAILNYFAAKDSSSAAYCLGLTGFIEFKSGLFKDAYEDIKSSIDIADQINDLNALTLGYYYMGILEFEVEKNHDKALTNFDKAIALASQRGDSTTYYSILNGQTQVLMAKGEHETAIKKTLKIAEYHLRNKMMRDYAVDLHNLGYTYSVMKQWDKSLEYHNKSLQLSKDLKDKNAVLEEMYNIGTVQLEAGRYHESIKTYLETLKMAEAMDNVNHINLVSAGLAEGYEKTGDYRAAFTFLKKHKSLNDSIESIETKQQLQELQVQFESEQKDKELAIVRAENLASGEKMSRANNLRNILLLMLAALIILVAGLYNRYQFKQKTAKKLEEKNAIIEYEKERAEKSEQDKQFFLASMSHEIRTPLNAIIGISELMDPEELNDKNRHYTNALKDSSTHLMNLINNVLDISKMESGNLDISNQIFETGTWVNSLHNMFSPIATQKGLKLQIHHDLPATLYADPDRIKQILINLLGNAIKYTSTGSVILYLNIEKLDNAALFLAEVRDSGPGIRETKLPYLFSKFANINEVNQRSENSSGLGLHISQEIAKALGGEILVSSMWGKGSTFTLSVPVEIPLHADSNVIEHRSAVNKVFENGLQLLIAEDNVYNQMVIKDLLKKHVPSVSVTILQNGNDIVPALENTSFDMLLLDLEMPGRQGTEVLSMIRNSKNETIACMPVIILSASTTKSQIESAMLAGANAFVNKPIQIQSLIRTIANVLKDSEWKTENIQYKAIESNKLAVRKVESALISYTDNNQVLMEAEINKFHKYLRDQLLPDIRNKWSFIPEDDLRRKLHDLRPQLLFFGFDNLADAIYQKEIQLKTTAREFDKTAFLADLETQLEQVLVVLTKHS